jgi:hypothetical protein
VEALYQAIVAGKPVNMTKDATDSTLSCLLGRMAYETKREVTWEELMASESSSFLIPSERGIASRHPGTGGSRGVHARLCEDVLCTK